jgi:hypothetical protein
MHFVIDRFVERAVLDRHAFALSGVDARAHPG